jgi:hypothetical protein
MISVTGLALTDIHWASKATMVVKMLRLVGMGVGLICTLGVIAASMGMNFLFGYGFGTTVEAARVWGGLSVASDGLKAVLPVVVAHQVAARHWGRALAGVVIFPLVLGYGFMSALGFASQSRGVVVSGRENLNATYAETKSDLAAAESKLAKMGGQRLVGLIEVELAGLRRDRMWAGSGGCLEARTYALRAYCQKADALGAELLQAKEAQDLTAKIDRLKADVKDARERGGTQVADYQAGALAWVLGDDRQKIGTGLSWLAALLVEVISAFGLLMVDQARRKAKSEEKPEVPWKLVGEAVEAEA